MNKGTVQDIAFYSESLQEEMRILIYVPANYSPLYQYHVCIASDGRDYFQLGALPRLADALIEDYEIEQTIFVGVPYKDAHDRTRKYIPSGDLFNAYMKFLSSELIPYIDAEFSTLQLASSRILMGDSMAATASLLGVLNYPNIFGKAIMQSPFVDDLVLQQVEQFKHTDTTYFYHVIGLLENEVITTTKEVKDFLTPNRQLHDIMKSNGFQVFYDEFNGNHSWKYWKPDLTRALTKIFE